MSLPASVTGGIYPLQQLYDSLFQLKVSNYSSVSALTVIVYDIATVLSREVSPLAHTFKNLTDLLVEWTLPKDITVQFTSVSTRFNVPVDVRCKIYLWWYSLGGPIVFTTITNILLTIRVYALYDRNIKVLPFLLLILFAGFAAGMYVSVKSSKIVTAAVFPAPLGLPFTGCPAIVQTNFVLEFWIPCLIVAFLYFFMTAYKVFKVIQNVEGKNWSVTEWRSRSISMILLVCVISTALLTISLQGFFVPNLFTCNICDTLGIKTYIAATRGYGNFDWSDQYAGWSNVPSNGLRCTR
ncbi:hypothetical protein BDQ17DRAFT_1329825 [Cyathus striatus]|nr:hypothetical protein BDQ17DRAFT_1329825 [Cyathus striatus]